MRIEGQIWRDGKFWIVEIPALDLVTQGLSRTAAYRVAGTVVEDVVGKTGFHVTVHKAGGDGFFLESNRSQEMIALLLRRQRMKRGITVREASRLIGSTSPNAWGAYEQGKRAPTLDQLEKMIRALDRSSQLVIRIDRAA